MAKNILPANKYDLKKEEKIKEAISKIVDYLDKHEFDQQAQSFILSRCIAEVVIRSRKKRLTI